MLIVDLNVLDVGQGSGNLVQVYDGARDPMKLITTFLFDAGSQRENEGAAASVEYVIGVLREMASTQKGPARMAALVLSHSDRDHISLLPEILGAFDPPTKNVPTKPVLIIDAILYGGSASQYGSAPNVISLARKYLSKDPVSGIGDQDFRYNESGVRDTHWESVWPWPGKGVHPALQNRLALYLISVNSTARRGIRAGFYKWLPSMCNVNTGSLVALLELTTPDGPRRFVISGDATAETMAWCCNHLIGQVLSAFHLTIPHHGSGTTAFKITDPVKKSIVDAGFAVLVKGKRATTEVARKNLKEFARRIAAQSVSASAGQFSQFHHPEALVLRYFGTELSDDFHFKDETFSAPRPLHYVSAWVEEELFPKFTDDADSDQKVAAGSWPPKKETGWRTIPTSCNVYTSQYVVPGCVDDEHQLIPLPLTGSDSDSDDGDDDRAREDNPLAIHLVEDASYDIAGPTGVNWRFSALEDGNVEIAFVEHEEIIAAAALGQEMPAARAPATAFVRRDAAPSRSPTSREAPVTLAQRLLASMATIG